MKRRQMKKRGMERRGVSKRGEERKEGQDREDSIGALEVSGQSGSCRSSDVSREGKGHHGEERWAIWTLTNRGN